MLSHTLSQKSFTVVYGPTLTPVTITFPTLVTMLKSTMSCVEVDVDAVPLEEVDVVVLEEGVASGSS